MILIKKINTKLLIEAAKRGDVAEVQRLIPLSNPKSRESCALTSYPTSNPKDNDSYALCEV